MTKPLILDDTDIRQLGITAAEMVDAIEATLRDKIAGRVLTTPKSMIAPGDGRYMMTTLATGPDFTVVKAVTVCPNNPDKGLPSITGSISVLDSQTGETRVVMDAEWITGIRTAALSLLSGKFLANPESTSIGFIGCGAQARAHLEVFSAFFPIKKIVLFGRGQMNIERLCCIAARHNLACDLANDPIDAMECDIVVSSLPVTYDGPPFLDARQMHSDALAIITDAAKTWIKKHLNVFKTIVTDDFQQEVSQPEPMVPASQITGDLCDLLSQSCDIQTGPKAFMFRGIAAADYAAAALIYGKFAKNELG